MVVTADSWWGHLGWASSGSRGHLLTKQNNWRQNLRPPPSPGSISFPPATGLTQTIPGRVWTNICQVLFSLYVSVWTNPILPPPPPSILLCSTVRCLIQDWLSTSCQPQPQLPYLWYRHDSWLRKVTYRVFPQGFKK